MKRTTLPSLPRLVAIALLAILPRAAAALPQAAPPDPTAGPMPGGLTNQIADDAANALWWGDFDKLEAQYRAVRQSTDLVDGGTTRLQWFRKGLSRVFDEDDATDPYFAQLEAQAHAWAIERPHSALAQLLYARALFSRAYSFRGGDWASKVPEPAMREFKRYMQMAADQLRSHADLLKQESTATVYLLGTGRNLGWDFDRLHGLAVETLARNPVDDRGFVELATASLPKWGGSARQFDEVVYDAMKRVRPGSGMAMYASYYDDFANDFPGELSDSSEVNWSVMKRGFRDWMARWPSEYMLNRFALEACLAQDRATTLELLERIGTNPQKRAWGNRFETCRRWARTP